MSPLVTRPCRPVPGTRARSTPCSAAIRRTSGEVRGSSAAAASGAAGAAGTCAGAAGTGAGVGGGGGAGAGAAFGAAAGARVGAAAGAAATPTLSPASAMTPMTLSTATVLPASWRILASVPAAGEGTSASTLSVEISSSGSSLPTCCPSLLNHLTIVPSVIDSPICGITTLTGIGLPSLFRHSRTAAGSAHSS